MSELATRQVDRGVRGRLMAAIVAVTSLAGASIASSAEPRLRPVALLELYTSQGCSSCPPADELLSRLAADPAWSEKAVPIAFHVDYWNYIGWTDPFSRHAWSERQERYAAAFATDRIYTPQLIVQGRHDCNGTDAGCIRRALENLQPSGDWSIESVALERTGSTLRLRVRVRGEPGSASPRLFAALIERGLETAVGRGENARRTLHNDNVVRRLVDGGKAPRQGESSLTLELDPLWRVGGLGLVVFLQEVPSMAVATAVRVPAGDLAAALARP